MDYKDYSDSELMYLVKESNEDAKDIILEKYRYVIDIIFSKYKSLGKNVGLESSDLYQEALLGFMDAVNNYSEKKDVKLVTFISFCVRRRLNMALMKANRVKHRFLNDSLSLEHYYDNIDATMMDLISDNEENNPLNNLMNEEEFLDLNEKIKEHLSKNEYEVYELLRNGFSYTEIATLLDKTPKSVDNAIQRIKGKVRKILAERYENFG